MQTKRIVVIVGPTSSGKSALAVELAKKFNGEIISADSRQVYRGLTIGTGKITKKEMRGIPHHLLDVASPKSRFTAHDFVVQAERAIAEITSRGKVPIICGGTGFYIDALLGRVSLSHVAANEKLRARLGKKTAEQLFALLNTLDSKRTESIDRHNKRRLIRAIEIATSFTAGTRDRPPTPYEALWIGLMSPQDVLRERINTRLKKRLRSGMVAEARRLKRMGLSYKRMHDLGLEYRSLSRHLQGAITREQLERELQSAIWQYAKRQMTYWRRNNEINWFGPKEIKSIAKTVTDWLKHQ